MKGQRMFLILASLINFVISGLHIYIITQGAPAYRSFGAGEEMARAAEKGSSIPALVTFGIALVFFVWGLYALAGARVIPELPWTRTILIVIAAIYVARGLGVFYAPFVGYKRDPFMVITSGVSLGAGLIHAAGLFT
jgi:putative oxidoreductase